LYADPARPFVYRISRYMDTVLDMYLAQDYPSHLSVDAGTSEIYRAQKHNVAMTIMGAYGLLAQGLFVQSGILLRTAVEASMVLLDVALHPKIIDDLAKNKYDSKSVLRNLKGLIPRDVVRCDVPPI